MKFVQLLRSIFTTKSSQTEMENLNSDKAKFLFEIKKYERTYELLEEYDKKATKSSDILVESGRLREFTTGI